MSKRPIAKGCGWSLISLAVIAVLFAFFMACGSVVADKHAGEENEKEWTEYNAWTAQLDQMEDTLRADSLRETRQAPHIRQGGFASMFGIFFGLCIIIIALIPLGIGLYLIR